MTSTVDSSRVRAVIHRPAAMGAFEFVVLATLRAAQLMRGCLPRVDGTHRPTITAQCEVAEGKVTQMPRATSGVVEHGAAALLRS
jgi:DNA-directed RNA polymerase subunit K/omega